MHVDIKNGLELLAQGDLAAANSFFKGLLAGCPNNLDALKAMVRISRRRRNRYAAMGYAERVIALEPEALFEAALFALLTACRDLEATKSSIPRLLDIASHQGLCAMEADLLIRVIQISSVGRRRIEALQHVQRLLLSRTDLSHCSAVDEQIIAAELSFALEDYDDLIHRVDTLKDFAECAKFVTRIEALSNVTKKLSAPTYPDFNAEKVFGIGLSRTGTSSLNEALKVLGYGAVHWINPITRDLIDQQDLFVFDAFTDICISHNFEWLYHTYPNAKFILTTRPMKSWARSVERHYLEQHDCNGPRGLTTASAKNRFRTRAGQMEANLYGAHDTWEEAHSTFSDRVENFFHDKPRGRLLKLAITEGQGYETLCPFLGHPVPQTAFPAVNRSRTRLEEADGYNSRNCRPFENA